MQLQAISYRYYPELVAATANCC